MTLPDAVIVLEAVLCHHLLASGAVWVALTDALGDGPTDGEVKLAAGDLMPLIAVGNETLVQVLQCEGNAPVVSSVVEVIINAVVTQ